MSAIRFRADVLRSGLLVISGGERRGRTEASRTRKLKPSPTWASQKP